MENTTENYDAGTDQNQGVVGTMARNQEHADVQDSNDRVSRLDPVVDTDQTNAQPEDELAADTNEGIGERAYVADEEVQDNRSLPLDDTKKL